MSYCRNFDKDNQVYMFQHIDGFIECCGCMLGGIRCEHCGNIEPPKDWMTPKKLKKNQFKTRTAAIKHLLKHRAEGHKFPDYAIQTLKDEIEVIGDKI